MIRALRQRHRHTFVALGLFLPVAFALGIAVRKPIPVMAPPAALIAPAEYTVTLWNQPGLFPKSPVQTRLLRETSDSHHFAVSFNATSDFIEPDLLVYGVPGGMATTNNLAENAILLGQFATPALPVPDSLVQTNSVFVLYSLANHEIVDVSKPIQLSDSIK